MLARNSSVRTIARLERQLILDDVVNAKSALKGEHISPEAAKKQGEAWAAKAGSKLDGVVGAHYVWYHYANDRPTMFVARSVKLTRPSLARPARRKTSLTSSSTTVLPPSTIPVAKLVAL